MNRLPTEKRCRIIHALVEGNSMRSTSRMTGASINTVKKLLIDAGRTFAEYQHDNMRNLNCQRLQVDEIWSFCYCKEKNVPEEHKGKPGYGDVWTFTAIDADTKLVPSFIVGARDACYASAFLKDIASRIKHRIQLTTDGHKMYIEATDKSFGTMIDYAMLIKQYGNNPNPENPSTRYSPGECCGIETRIITGKPGPDHVSTSYVERQNLSMRMGMRRFTRLTNGFSKKLEHLEHAVALYFMHYNYVRRHKTLRMPPALKAGVTDHSWTMEEMVSLIP